MVLPIYKVVSLVIRVASKPLIAYTKQMHLKNGGVEHPFIRNRFIWLGNTYNKWQTYINRRFMKIQSQFAYKPLNDELAIEKGIQLFYEILFYSIVIGFPLYEMWRASEQGKQKSKKLEQRLKNIESNLAQMCKIQEKDQIEKKQRMEQIKEKEVGKQIGVNTEQVKKQSKSQRSQGVKGLKPISLKFCDGRVKQYVF